MSKLRDVLDMPVAPSRATLLDMLRGGLLGATTDTVGYIPDAVADFMRPFGYNVPSKDVVGGTEWLANRVSKPTNSLAETAARFTTGMLTPSPADFARLGKGMKSDMTVYHGSPHDFDAFDSSKIGTGEGAQAYGHGLYVADSTDVAKAYVPRDFKIEDALMSRYKSAEKAGRYDELEVLEAALLHQTPAELRQTFAGRGFDHYIDTIEAYTKKATSGHLYTVDLPDSHIDNMLDWDAPLSQQPESVRKVLTQAIAETQAPTYDAARRMKQLEKKLAGFESWQMGGPAFQKLHDDHTQLQRKVEAAAKGWENSTGGELYNILSSGLVGQEKASKNLRSAGIPGIKYLDGGSRSAGQGSRNYVVFDDKLLKILNKE